MNITTSAICLFTYRIHQHHGWNTVFSAFADSRSEFNDKLSELYHDEANRSENHSLSTGTLADVIAEYGEEVPEKVQNAAGPFVAVHWNHGYEVESFATLAEAEKQASEWSYEIGFDRVHCDLGGHAGKTMIVDLEPRVSVNFDRFSFSWEKDELADAEAVRSELEDQTDDETPMPSDADLSAVADAINSEMEKFLDR